MLFYCDLSAAAAMASATVAVTFIQSIQILTVTVKRDFRSITLQCCGIIGAAFCYHSLKISEFLTPTHSYCTAIAQLLHSYCTDIAQLLHSYCTAIIISVELFNLQNMFEVTWKLIFYIVIRPIKIPTIDWMKVNRYNTQSTYIRLCKNLIDHLEFDVMTKVISLKTITPLCVSSDVTVPVNNVKCAKVTTNMRPHDNIIVWENREIIRSKRTSNIVVSSAK